MKLRHFILISTLFAASHALAGVSKLSSPTVTKGKVEVEYSATRLGDSSKAKNNNQSHVFELEYGITDDFKLGVEAKSARTSSNPHSLKAYGLEAQYELTQQDAWWLSTAIKGEYAQAVEKNDADELELKLIAARRVGDVNLLGNLGLGREFGRQRDAGVSLEAKLQALLRMDTYFNPGLEWHGDFGALHHLSEHGIHEYYAGPVARGSLFKVAGGEIQYAAGYFWGISDAAADNAARIQLSYEMMF